MCDLHHKEKTNGLLPSGRVVSANQNPFNQTQSHSRKHQLHFSGSDVCVEIGGSTFTYENLSVGQYFCPYMIDGEQLLLFRADQGELLINFRAYDNNDIPIIEIVDNELTYNFQSWDITWRRQTLQFRDGSRKIRLELKFQPPNKIIISRGIISYRGIECWVGKNYFFVANNHGLLGRVTIKSCPIGYAIGDKKLEIPAALVQWIPSPREPIDHSSANAFLKKHLKIRTRS